MEKKVETDVLIIGQGITGSSIARELSQYKVDVTAVEKSPDSVPGQTKGSHGLLYSGRSLVMAFSLVLKSIMAPGEPLWHPETLKIRLATEGYQLFGELAEKLDIAYKPTKFLLIARNEEEFESLKALVSIVGAIIYFINPFDIIPDFITGLGFFDDAAVITYVMKTLQDEIDLFQQYLKERGDFIPNLEKEDIGDSSLETLPPSS